MIDLSPIDIIPLIQLWATISVLFFYQPFFRKHPLEPQLDELNESLERFYEQFQGFIFIPNPEENKPLFYYNYLSIRWDGFFLSIKRMTALIFFYSIFLLFYLGKLKDHTSLYHSYDSFFLISTNLYMCLWLAWHLIKPLKKIYKRWATGSVNNIFDSNKERKKNNLNIKIIRIYCFVFFFFFCVLLVYFFFFRAIDSYLSNCSIRFYYINPTVETLLTLFTIFLIVPILILSRLVFDYIQIKILKKRISELPPTKDIDILLDLQSKPKDSIQASSSELILQKVKLWKNASTIDKEDIREYLEYNARIFMHELEKSFLDITEENDKPVKGAHFTENQEIQLNVIFQKQLELFYNKCKDNFNLKTDLKRPSQTKNPNSTSLGKMISEMTRRLKDILKTP